MRDLLAIYLVACSSILLSGLLLLLIGLAVHRQRNRPEERIESAPAEVIDFKAALAVRDRTRRGPAAIAGPPSRDRLPL